MLCFVVLSLNNNICPVAKFFGVHTLLKIPNMFLYTSYMTLHDITRHLVKVPYSRKFSKGLIFGIFEYCRNFRKFQSES